LGTCANEFIYTVALRRKLAAGFSKSGDFVNLDADSPIFTDCLLFFAFFSSSSLSVFFPSRSLKISSSFVSPLPLL
jgi:hypothetical protein